jgi:hypothetical protein
MHDHGHFADRLPAAGAAAPSDRVIDGHNMLPVASSRAKSPHDAIYWPNREQLAVRRGKWKLELKGTGCDGTAAGSG